MLVWDPDCVDLGLMSCAFAAKLKDGCGRDNTVIRCDIGKCNLIHHVEA